MKVHLTCLCAVFGGSGKTGGLVGGERVESPEQSQLRLRLSLLQKQLLTLRSLPEKQSTSNQRYTTISGPIAFHTTRNRRLDLRPNR